MESISIPHRYRAKQDIEIAGLMAALFSWGNRTAIIKKPGGRIAHGRRAL
ncbi:MAG: DUF2400 family protein [Saprospiraceae bacterium]|nr:DUF2400 family protein [Saprospiraceae bacterium]